MPRVRFTARACLVAAVSAGVCAVPALAAPPVPRAPKQFPPRPRTAAPGPRPGETEARRRDEVDTVQRQDVAAALKQHFNIDVDWRTTSLEKLVDIRVRAAKAAELQQRLGVVVEWQRYSWIELEALRRTLINFERYRDEHGERVASTPAPARPGAQPAVGSLAAIADHALVEPTFKARPPARGGRTTDPDGIIRPTFAGRAGAPAVATDPDGVIRPTFGARPRWPAFASDPDGLIAPTFVPYRRLSSMGDADDLQGDLQDDLIDPTRAPVPARW